MQYEIMRRPQIDAGVKVNIIFYGIYDNTLYSMR